MGLFLIIVYGLCMLFVTVFSLMQLQLALLYRRSKKRQATTPEATLTSTNHHPVVTVQLPVYNEKYVVRRLLNALAQLDWPHDKLEIQILDDSDDETSGIIRDTLATPLFRQLDIYHIRRSNRSGFKAGALQYGLKAAKGEFIAIFDADFVPHSTFLRDTLPAFANPAVGMVQTKWSHLNQDFSMLTRLQAFGLNGHFRVEQTARQEAGSFINFNGTGGIWRKACITDAGGWQTDTLTEDLDLSYRAQLKGWRFEYLENVNAPAELPVIMSAVKSQQFRWTKGGAETAKKNLSMVFKSNLKPINKIHAFFHLTNSANFLLLLLASLVSIPLLWVKYTHPELRSAFDFGSLFAIGFLAISYFYWIANRQDHSGLQYLKEFPLFLVFSMGFTLNNSLAVIEGLLGMKTPFVRTPKFNIVGTKGAWKGNGYLQHKLTIATWLEGLLSLYFFAGLGLGIALADYGLVLFHLMFALGFAGIFYYSIKY